MKSLQPGEKRLHTYTVKSADFAAFENGLVHKVCSTYTLGREMEWSSRLFVLDVTEADEEGVGTMLEISHQAPAFEGETLTIEATVERIMENELICVIKVMVDDRLVATGRTGQKILKRERIRQIFTRLDS